MSRFILIDPALQSVGGYHYQCARDLVEAAACRGLDGVLVTNRRFRRHNDLPSDWKVLPLFPHGGRARRSLRESARIDGPIDEQGRPLPGGGEGAVESLGWTQRWQQSRRLRSRARYLKAYEASLAAAFRQLGILPDDQIVFAAASEFDLLGLARFLRSDPSTRGPVWHLQFRSELLAGRAGEHAAQADRLQFARRQFQYALRLVPQHKLEFHSATEPLVRQYRQLKVGEFSLLPYPVSPSFKPPTQLGPLKPRWNVLCAGNMRSEEGLGDFRDLVAQLDTLPLASRINLRAQIGRPPRWLRTREEGGIAVDPVRHPLPTGQYVDLVRNSDLGLFLHDSRRYAARCSGILIEMLSCGIPVIVPAGCWMADQLAPAHTLWMDQLLNRRTDAQAKIVPVANQRLESAWPAEAAQVLIELQTPQASPSGCYAEFRWTQGGGHAGATILGADTPVTRLLVDRGADAADFQLEVRGAYGESAPAIAKAVLRFLGPRDGALEPQSAVGLIAPSHASVPWLMTELHTHYEHYRRSAIAFSEAWRKQHAPRRIVELLGASPSSEMLRAA